MQTWFLVHLVDVHFSFCPMKPECSVAVLGKLGPARYLLPVNMSSGDPTSSAPAELTDLYPEEAAIL